MKISKIKILKSYNALITILMALLGFATSCEPLAAEYGVPHADFIVKGKIASSQTSNPIANIKVRMHMDSISPYYDSAYTDSKGDYQVTASSFPQSESFLLEFIDVDGIVNSEFQQLDTIIEFKDPVFTGGGKHWYNGKTEKELNITLKPK